MVCPVCQTEYFDADQVVCSSKCIDGYYGLKDKDNSLDKTEQLSTVKTMINFKWTLVDTNSSEGDKLPCLICRKTNLKSEDRVDTYNSKYEVFCKPCYAQILSH